MADSETGTAQTEAERNLAAMIDLSWNTNWSQVPQEAERHAEEAFEHLTEARDIAQEANEESETVEDVAGGLAHADVESESLMAPIRGKRGVPRNELEDLVEKWSEEAQQASEEDCMEYSVGLSAAADDLRELINS